LPPAPTAPSIQTYIAPPSLTKLFCRNVNLT
jgi:hypothetical protein